MTPLLQIAGLTVRFGAVTVLDGLDLTVGHDELFVLLGGSGSGKTTLLRTIGGFVAPSAGTIRLDGADLVPLPPHRRPVNTVFQSGALFPHLSVAANIGFGPRQRGMSRRDTAARVADLLALVRLEGFGHRRPDQLSGGQQQRAALARGLAAEPSLLLLDEPLSALDRGLRAETAAELVRLRRRLGLSFILVTHDQREALTMANRIGVMRGGRMAQVGTPQQIYDAPADRDLAAFMGVENFFEATIPPGQAMAEVRGLGNVPLSAPAGPVCVALRGERVRLGPDGGPVQVAGEVIDTVYNGGTTMLTVRAVDGANVVVAAPGPVSGRVILSFSPADCLVYPA